MPPRRLTHMRTITGLRRHNPMILRMDMSWNVAIARERHWSGRANYVPMMSQKLKTRARIARKNPINVCCRISSHIK